jgi:hypothetical protein
LRKVIGAGDVPAEHDGAPADSLDGTGRLADAGGVRQVEDGNVRPGLGETDRDALADAAAGACHECNLAGQTEHLHRFLPFAVMSWRVP